MAKMRNRGQNNKSAWIFHDCRLLPIYGILFSELASSCRLEIVVHALRIRLDERRSSLTIYHSLRPFRMRQLTRCLFVSSATSLQPHCNPSQKAHPPVAWRTQNISFRRARTGDMSGAGSHSYLGMPDRGVGPGLTRCVDRLACAATKCWGITPVQYLYR